MCSFEEFQKQQQVTRACIAGLRHTHPAASEAELEAMAVEEIGLTHNLCEARCVAEHVRSFFVLDAEAAMDSRA